MIDVKVTADDLIGIGEEVSKEAGVFHGKPEAVIPINLLGPLERGLVVHYSVFVPIRYGDCFDNVTEKLKQTLLARNSRSQEN